MIKFRKLYFDDEDVQEIDLPGRISALRCDMVAERRQPQIKAQDGHRELVETFIASASRRHLPLFSLKVSVSSALDRDVPAKLRSLIELRGRGSSDQTPEPAVSPIAIFRGHRPPGSKDVRWRLIVGGLIHSLTIDHGFDELDDSLTELSVSILDCRLETDFLQSVDIVKMDPNWHSTGKSKTITYQEHHAKRSSGRGYEQ